MGALNLSISSLASLSLKNVGESAINEQRITKLSHGLPIKACTTDTRTEFVQQNRLESSV